MVVVDTREEGILEDNSCTVIAAPLPDAEVVELHAYLEAA